jgi:hypothetical protein
MFWAYRDENMERVPCFGEGVPKRWELSNVSDTVPSSKKISDQCRKQPVSTVISVGGEKTATFLVAGMPVPFSTDVAENR